MSHFEILLTILKGRLRTISTQCVLFYRSTLTLNEQLTALFYLPTTSAPTRRLAPLRTSCQVRQASCKARQASCKVRQASCRAWSKRCEQRLAREGSSSVDARIWKRDVASETEYEMWEGMECGYMLKRSAVQCLHGCAYTGNVFDYTLSPIKTWHLFADMQKNYYI